MFFRKVLPENRLERPAGTCARKLNPAALAL